MLAKKIFIPIVVIVVLAVIGYGILHGQRNANQEPVLIIKPVEVEKPATAPKPPPPGETHATGHWHGDEWHSEPHEPEVSAVEAAPPAPSETTQRPPSAPETQTPKDFVNPTSKSSNPLFADGVPKHLQCPPEFIGAYARGLEPETIERLQQRGVEILEKWNPNRPLTEVWDAFIEAEKWYHDNADPERVGSSWGAGRIDWQLQVVLDFPEIGVLAQEDLDRSFNMWRVARGEWDPNFNVCRFTLPDGRVRMFRTDDDKKYVFTSTTYTETEDGFESSTSTSTSGPSNGDPNAEVIHINLDEMTDEELERLSGWNYNINPYTTGAYKLGDNR